MSSIAYDDRALAISDDILTHNRSSRPASTWSQFSTTWLSMAFTSAWLGFTIFFAWNSTLVDPFMQSMLPSMPSHTITALNILSHVTVFLLQIFTSIVFEALRWAFACREHGISSFSFMVMSRAIAPLGVMYLLFFDCAAGSFWTGHRLWGFQRYSIPCGHD